MKINIIAAVAKNRAIGYNNDMVYFIKEDLRRFKELTTGHTAIDVRKQDQAPRFRLPIRSIFLPHALAGTSRLYRLSRTIATRR